MLPDLNFVHSREADNKAVVSNEVKINYKGCTHMAVLGFNVGSILSIEDMSLAIDYLSDKNAFEPELQKIKDLIRSKEKEGTEEK